MYLKDTFFENFEIVLDGTRQTNIGARMPTQIFFVFGLVNYVGGVTADNVAIIVPGNEDNLWLTLKMGSNDRIERIRLSDATFNAAADRKYLNLNFPGAIDLDQSFIENPTGIVATVALGLWYLPKGPDTVDLANRMEKGELDIMEKFMIPAAR